MYGRIKVKEGRFVGYEGQMDKGMNATISGNGLKVIRETGVATWNAYVCNLEAGCHHLNPDCLFM